jgi:type VI secretion system protein ImpK
MRLIDCFSELLAYTVYVAGKGSSEGLTYDEANARYEDLYDRAGALRSRLQIPDRDWVDANFAVCAYIDEMILCSAWAGRDAWQTNQLQHRFFNTTNAGAEFFEHVTGLEPGRENVREVYDWCLAMGFKGMYFRPEDSADLEEMTKQNRGLIRRSGISEDGLLMFPEAYGTDRKERRKGVSGLLLFTIIAGLIPALIFFGLYYFYSNILNGILAVYFQ